MTDPPKDVAISVVNLRVSYGEREILHGITFDVHRGETMVILGGSGSGQEHPIENVGRFGKADLRRSVDPGR